MSNIWSIADEDDPKSEQIKKHTSDEEIVTSSLEEDLDRPSFLRRIGRRHKEENTSDSADRHDNSDKS